MLRLRHAEHGLSFGIAMALEMNTVRVLVCLSTAALAWPSTLAAQSLPAPAQSDQATTVLGAGAYSCVDPADALARRTIQAEPCRWPMVHFPATAGAGSGEPRRLPSYAPKSTGSEGHAMFWRFPVQPRAPYDAPRHTWH